MCKLWREAQHLVSLVCHLSAEIENSALDFRGYSRSIYGPATDQTNIWHNFFNLKKMYYFLYLLLMFYDTFNREMILFEKCLSLALGRERKYFLTYVGCVDCESKLHGHGYIQQPGTSQCRCRVFCCRQKLSRHVS